MAIELLGEELDNRSGGEDSIFPTTRWGSNRCFTGRVARPHWFHARFLMIEGDEMSKSAGTCYVLEDLLTRCRSGHSFGTAPHPLPQQRQFHLQGLKMLNA